MEAPALLQECAHALLITWDTDVKLVRFFVFIFLKSLTLKSLTSADTSGSSIDIVELIMSTARLQLLIF